jgi:threonine/homoserine/homoserine lactone efflux protein
MIAVETLLMFTLASVVIELTPGPNMAWLAVVAATEGRRPGYAAVGGVALGLLVVGLAAAAGLAAAITASPLLYHALRWGGVAWLLWLAWDGWRDADDPPEAAPEGLRMVAYFRRGLITNLLNPKAAVFFIAVLPGFVSEPEAPLGQTVTLSLVYVAVATLIHGLIVTLAGAARALLADPRRSRRLRRALSAALALIALWFAWTTRG